MNSYSLTLPSYSFGDDVYSLIGDICVKSGKKAVAIGGKTAISKVKNTLLENIKDSEIEILDFIWYGGECTYENVDILKNNQAVKDADMIFAIGGGKAQDTGKALANEINKDIYTFPTIASNCAGVTSVSIMYNSDSSFKKPYFFSTPPKHCFIYTPVISQAPPKYIWAGMGDTYAKYFESQMSSKGEDLKHYHWLGKTVAQLCVDPILQYGKQAMDDIYENKISESLNQVILAITVTTGIASILLTQEHIIDYNTGLAHAVFYALTSFPQVEKNHLHGEVVAFGVLILLLVDNDKEMFDKMYNFNKSVKLPTCLKDIEMTDDELDQLVKIVCNMKDIDHNPYKVTGKMVKDAFVELENINYKKN